MVKTKVTQKAKEKPTRITAPRGLSDHATALYVKAVYDKRMKGKKTYTVPHPTAPRAFIERIKK